MATRPSKDEYYLSIAKEVSTLNNEFVNNAISFEKIQGIEKVLVFYPH